MKPRSLLGATQIFVTLYLKFSVQISNIENIQSIIISKLTPNILRTVSTLIHKHIVIIIL